VAVVAVVTVTVTAAVMLVRRVRRALLVLSSPSSVVASDVALLPLPRWLVV
jgi:hypothetical protein